MPDRKPERLPDRSRQNIQILIDRMPNNVIMRERTSHWTPQRMWDRRQKECQIGCHEGCEKTWYNECWTKFPTECQNMCQIEFRLVGSLKERFFSIGFSDQVWFQLKVILASNPCCAAAGATSWLVSYCLYDRTFRKNTKVLCWFCTPPPNRKCKGRVCDRTGLKHQQLSGALSGGGFKTALAEAYPDAFGADLASMLLSGWT